MNLLRIEQTYAKMGIESYNSQLNINSQLDRLDINQRHVKVELEKELPKVIIDQHDCFATSGLKNDRELLQETVQNAYAQAMEYTARKAQDGDLMADIRNRGNVIASIARRDSFEQHEFNIDLMPKARPRIDVQGYLNIRFKEGQASSTVNQGYLNIKFTEPKINMYVMQKPKLNIEYIGNNFDVKL